MRRGGRDGQVEPQVYDPKGEYHELCVPPVHTRGLLLQVICYLVTSHLLLVAGERCDLSQRFELSRLVRVNVRSRQSSLSV